MFLLTDLFSQIDYLELRDQYTLSCHKSDSIELIQNKRFLDSLTEYKITNGEEKFLYDYGMTYYTIYLKWKSIDALLKSTEANQKCWEEYQNYNALENLGMNYGILGDCDKKLELTELYIKEMIKNELDEYIDYKEIYYRYKTCRNN